MTNAQALAVVTAVEETPLSPAVRALADLLISRLPEWEHMREVLAGALADPDQAAWDQTAADWERANDRVVAALSPEHRRLHEEDCMLGLRLDDLAMGHAFLWLLGTLLGE